MPAISRTITRRTTKLRRSNGRKLPPVNKVISHQPKLQSQFHNGGCTVSSEYASFKLLSILLIANYIEIVSYHLWMSIFKTKQLFQDLKNRDKMKRVKEDITNNESDDSSNSFQPNTVPEKFEKTEREKEKS